MDIFMETLLINLLFFLVLVIIFILYWCLTKKKKSQKIPDSKADHDGYEEVLHHLVHDTKNHIATTSLALHNLEFVIAENKNLEHPVDEYIIAAKKALDDTTHKVQESLIFTRTGVDKFIATDMRFLVDKIILGLDENVNIIPKYENDLPFVDMDQQAIELAIRKLLEIATVNGNGHTITHINLLLHLSETIIPQIICTIYSQNLLNKSLDEEFNEFHNISNMSEPNRLRFRVAQKIIERHKGSIVGIYNHTQSVLFSFKLNIAGD